MTNEMTCLSWTLTATLFQPGTLKREDVQFGGEVIVEDNEDAEYSAFGLAMETMIKGIKIEFPEMQIVPGTVKKYFRKASDFALR